ncbi:heavy-metal-associated domain-containing protein [Pseudotenacibaculum sp. MALMAid0570]|uniref:heavy-metal-associated domain-containing protein n=1 Tax=Pseudotenacibaculum sp. MALMAid0570 TaxID=3143938 RepID=UPI0032DE38CC
MTTTIHIENLKCGGCAATIRKGILSIDSVDNVEVDVETSEVKVSHTKDVVTHIKEKLSKLGYPEAGDKNTVLHKAKSFVSCAVGRLEK